MQILVNSINNLSAMIKCHFDFIFEFDIFQYSCCIGFEFHLLQRAESKSRAFNQGNYISGRF